ncbi:MAG: hypothetical protein HY897_03380 [Deltaproteobacteria bacterium]|nr:hypothetical protein [Deltaproteobacteria bacterium]
MKRNLIADAVVHIAEADAKIGETIRVLDALNMVGRCDDVGLFAGKLATLVEARQALAGDLTRIWRRWATKTKRRKVPPSQRPPSRAARGRGGR